MAISFLNNLSSLYAENSLRNTWADRQSVLQQLSTGSRINSGADDPAGISIVDNLRAADAYYTQSQKNDAITLGSLQTADGALSQANNLLDSETTVATQAANGILTPAQYSAANLSYQSTLAELNNIGATTVYNGSSVFPNTGSGLSNLGINNSLNSSSVTDQANGRAALGEVNQAVSAVAAEQGSYGARINAVKASESVSQSEATSTESALNAIQCTDYAQAATNLAQDDLKLQFGTWAMAQANQTEQEQSQTLPGLNSSWLPGV